MDHGETSRTSPGQRLRRLLADGELVVAPGIFDGLSAHLVRRMGFRAGYLTGAGVAASGFGLPDIGLAGMTEMAGRVAMAAGAAIEALRGLGGSAAVTPPATMEQFFQLVGLDEWSAVSARWATDGSQRA